MPIGTRGDPITKTIPIPAVGRGRLAVRCVAAAGGRGGLSERSERVSSRSNGMRSRTAFRTPVIALALAIFAIWKGRQLRREAELPAGAPAPALAD